MMRIPNTRYFTVLSNYNAQQYQIDSSVRPSQQIISQSEPEIPKLNSCCAVSCQFHYTSTLHENHLSKTCFTCVMGVLSLHFVPCFVPFLFSLSKLNFCCVVRSRKCLMNMSTCSLCPACIMLLKRALSVCVRARVCVRLSKHNCFCSDSFSWPRGLFRWSPVCLCTAANWL